MHKLIYEIDIGTFYIIILYYIIYINRLARYAKEGARRRHCISSLLFVICVCPTQISDSILPERRIENKTEHRSICIFLNY